MATKTKHAELLTADDLRNIESRLMAHRTQLVNDIESLCGSFRASGESDVACEIRDKAKFLVNTIGCLRAIATTIKLAEIGSEVTEVPYLSDTGIED